MSYQTLLYSQERSINEIRNIDRHGTQFAILHSPKPKLSYSFDIPLQPGNKLSQLIHCLLWVTEQAHTILDFQNLENGTCLNQAVSGRLKRLPTPNTLDPSLYSSHVLTKHDFFNQIHSPLRTPDVRNHPISAGSPQASCLINKTEPGHYVIKCSNYLLPVKY